MPVRRRPCEQIAFGIACAAMVQSKARSVAEYLRALPADRRDAIAAVRELILANLGPGYEEGMSYGMIGYYVPHRLFPAGYHCDPKQPLPYAALASQKNYMSVYLMGLYIDPDDAGWFEKAWRAAGKKLDMGKCCVRFKKLDDVPFDVLAEAIRRMPAKRYIAAYQAQLAGGGWQRSASKKGAKKAAKKKAAKK
jgi:hypothetical protein